jgi:hypothetical protein
MGCPSRPTTSTVGTPRSEHDVLPVSLKSTPPASEEDEPPNLVNSTDADTDDCEQATAVVLAGLLVVGDVVWVADDPPEQAGSRPSDAAQRTDATRTVVARGPGTDGEPNRVMPVSRPTEGESGRGPSPDR